MNKLWISFIIVLTLIGTGTIFYHHTVFYIICSVSVGLYALSYLGRVQHPKLEKAMLNTFNNMPIKRLKELRQAFNRKTDIQN